MGRFALLVPVLTSAPMEHVHMGLEELDQKDVAISNDKQSIGNKLFPLVAKEQPELASKITGMLLELPNSTLQVFLSSEVDLHAAIAQALITLDESRSARHGERHSTFDFKARSSLRTVCRTFRRAELETTGHEN